MFAASKSGSVEAKDAQFNYVTMLLHGDGTNGAQNNTFLDSSTNAFSITRNGNTTQGTFTPYGSNWSNYLNGSSSLSVNVSGVAAGTSTFTFEAWVYLNAYPASDAPFYDTRSSNGATTTAMQFGVYSTGALKFYDGTETNLGGTVPLNQWVHIALVRNGSNVMTPYINGTATGTTVSSTRNFSDQYFWIGSVPGPASPYINAYLSNLRWVVGTAVYTSNFTPSTTSLTAITNTKILTCQSNRFVDNSSNTFAITLNGSPSVQRFSPFAPLTVYNPTTYGGSGYFDGSGDYLSAANNAAYNLNSVSFTVECWVYFNGLSGEQNIVEQFTPASGPGWTLYKFNTSTGSPAGSVDFYGGSTGLNSGLVPVAGQWYHLAISRNNATGTASFYVNGTRTATATFGVASSAATELLVGVRKSGTTWFNGYMEDLRIVKGTYIYDPTATTITVPTAPLTAVTNTQFLLNYTNAGILDNAMMNDLETVGNAQISTSVKKYGTGSMYFDGTGDYLAVPSTPNLGFGSGNFTVEAWLYLTSAPTGANAMYVCDFRNGSTNNFSFGVISSSGTKLYMFVGSGPVDATGSTSLSLNTWYHIAMVRSGSTVTYYLNGVSDATMTTSFSQGTTGVTVGARYTGSTEYVAGYIDDLRITKGVARYTANFTAPTTAFADKG